MDTSRSASVISDPSANQLHSDGYTVIDRLTDEVDSLRSAYADICAGRIDCGADDRMLGGITHQVMFPAKHDERFGAHPAVAAAKILAKQWMGWSNPELHFDMLICKPPQHPKPTPWHQDAAYGEQPFTPAGTTIHQRTLQFWLALDDVDETTGCMHFAPRLSLNTVMAHEVVGEYHGEESRLLQILPKLLPDPVPTVACPLRAGGCTVHHEGSWHMTTPNTSPDRWRRAYIFNLSDLACGYFDGDEQ